MLLTYSDDYLIQPGVDFYTCVIRNQEMDNKIGDDLSTDLTISAINGNVLTVPNLPRYERFSKETDSWLARSTNVNQTATLCTIDDIKKTVTVTNVSQFSVGHNIALFNPFLNTEFVGDQTSSSSLPPNVGIAWMNAETGSGPILPKKDGVYRWIFYGRGSYHLPGLATSYDMETWDVSNNETPILALDELPGSPSYCFFSGNCIVVDNSLCCILDDGNGVRIACFNEDVSDFTFTDYIVTNCRAGGLLKIDDEYHVLLGDASTGIDKSEIQAWKTSNINGPWTKYQNIVYGAGASAGVAWDYVCDSPYLFDDGYKIFGLFGAQAKIGVYSAGLGNVNRVRCLLNYDKASQTWSVDSRGPVIINPIDYPTPPYSWCYDHDGGYSSLFIEDGVAYFGTTFRGSAYQATMLRIKNYI